MESSNCQRAVYIRAVILCTYGELNLLIGTFRPECRYEDMKAKWVHNMYYCSCETKDLIEYFDKRVKFFFYKNSRNLLHCVAYRILVLL